MTTHYCHNCRYHALLPDGVHCAYCLAFFYSAGRLPCVTDKVAASSSPEDPTPAIARLYNRLDSMEA